MSDEPQMLIIIINLIFHIQKQHISHYPCCPCLIAVKAPVYLMALLYKKMQWLMVSAITRMCFKWQKHFFVWGNLKGDAPVCLCVFYTEPEQSAHQPVLTIIVQIGSFPPRLPWESSWGQRYPSAGFSLGQVRGCRMKYVQQVTAFHFEFPVVAAAVVDVVFLLYLFTEDRPRLRLSYATCYYDI